MISNISAAGAENSWSNQAELRHSIIKGILGTNYDNLKREYFIPNLPIIHPTQTTASGIQK